METSPLKKRIIITIGFVIFFSIIGFVLYYLITPPPTCSDKKQNQAEKGIDCGGPCSPCREVIQAKDIIIEETAVVPGGNGTYDAVAKIANPNDTLGASFFEYRFSLKDAGGNVIATRQGSSFLLPADSKYVSELGFQVENNSTSASVEFVISDAKWDKLNDIAKPQIGVYSKNFGKVSTGIGSGADGIIRNESGYDLNKIVLVVILRDDKGRIVGVNQTEKKTVRTKEERDFRLTWPYDLPAPVQSIEVDPQTNVFDRSNFSFTVGN